MSEVGEATVVEGPSTVPGGTTALSVDSLRDSLDRVDLELAATRLDRYTLVHKVGAGAHGSVWAAYDPQLDRRVALKLLFLRGAEVDPEVELRKMLGEAQMLAQVNHPNVVAIHDVREFGDFTGSGQRRGVYIVMEFLAGSTLREWMSAEPRGWEEVVRVFVEAGQGLVAAHRRKLVHRDFKPANVMFGADGRVRVVDFGVALFDDEGARGSGGGARIVGTPMYMAPEQHLGQAADPRSDQYAFCVALFEALYRRRAFVGQDARELAQAKFEGPPEVPAHAPKVPARLYQALARGLAVAPEERFEDMETLLRELLDDPVVRRRRWLSLAALLAVVAGAGYGLAQVQARAPESCAPPPEAFAGVWDQDVRSGIALRLRGVEDGRARESLAKLEHGLDAWASSWSATYEQACEASRARASAFDHDAPARQCLDRARRRLGGLTAVLLEAESGVLSRAQDALISLPRPRECVLQESPQLSPRASDPERNAAIMAIEGEVARSRALRGLGRYDEALELATQARERAEELEDYAGAAEAARLEADVQATFERFDEALAAAELGLRYAVRADDPQTGAWALLRKMEIHRNAGELEAAGAVAGVVEAYVDVERLGPQIAIEREIELGLLAQYERRLEVAEGHVSEALEQAEAYYGAAHPRLASIHGMLGSIAIDRGRNDDGIAHYRAALELNRSIYGERHDYVAASLNNIATVLYSLGELEASGAGLREALDINEEVFGHDSVKLVPYLMNLANVLDNSGELEQALRHQRRALELARASLPELHPMVARMHISRALTLGKLERVEDSLEDLRAAMRMHEAIYGPTHVETMVVMGFVAEALRELGGPARETEAARLEDLLLDVFTRELPEEVEFRGDAYGHLSRIYALRGDHERALEWAEKELEHEIDISNPGSVGVAQRGLQVVELLVELGRREQALARAQAALAGFEDRARDEALVASLEAQIAALSE